MKQTRGYCEDCIVPLKYDKIREHGRTLQLICPNCGALYYSPAWGKSVKRKGSVRQALKRLR